MNNHLEYIFGTLVIGILVYINGFFAAGEYSMVGVRRSQIQYAADKNDKRAKLLLKYLDNPDKFIAICQLGVTFTSLGLGWFSEPFISELLRDILANLSLSTNLGSYIRPVSFTVSFTIITVIHIVLGEQVPKMMSLQRTREIALRSVIPIHFFGMIFSPLIKLIIVLQSGPARLLGLKTDSEQGGGSWSEEELKMMIILAAQGGILEDREKELVLRSISFVDYPIEQIMVPRIYINAVDQNISCREAVKVMRKVGNSRLAVYYETIDNIVGIAYVKDIAPLIVTEEIMPGTLVLEVSRKPLFLPATLKAYDALEAMQKHKIEFAVVVDEHGGTAGVITTEDLIEELVGEIYDEYDSSETGDLISIQDEKSMLIKGRMVLSSFENLTGISVESDKYHTVAGLVLEKLGRMAQKGDIIELENTIIEVVAVDKQTVKVLLVKKEG